MEWFEKQFAKRNKLLTPGGVVYFVDVLPSNQDVTSGSCAPYPVLIASGWGETLELLKENIFLLAQSGYRVLALDYSKIDKIYGTHDGIPTTIYSKASSLISLLEKLDIEKIDVIGHSEGAINASVAAQINSHKFRKIILVAPGGMTKSMPTFFSLSWRFLYSIFVQSFQRATSWEQKKIAILCVKERFKYVVLNPIQSFVEANNIARFTIKYVLRDILRNGVLVNIVHSRDDKVFPLDEILKVAYLAKIDNNFYITDGCHHDIFINPYKFLDFFNNILRNP